MDIAKKIEQAVKRLELDKEFPHKHWEGCYSYDGHRTDLDCNLSVTPTPCHRCDGTGKYDYWGRNQYSACPKCGGSGILGGTLEAQKAILKYLERDEQLDRLLQES